MRILLWPMVILLASCNIGEKKDDSTTEFKTLACCYLSSSVQQYNIPDSDVSSQEDTCVNGNSGSWQRGACDMTGIAELPKCVTDTDYRIQNYKIGVDSTTLSLAKQICVDTVTPYVTIKRVWYE